MLDEWDRWYPNCDPVGYRLRQGFPDRWVRFHSLPESKRYPESDDEYAEVFARHNAVLGTLTQPGETVVLVTVGYSEFAAPMQSCPELSEVDPAAEPWRTIAMHEADGFDEPAFWHLCASVWEWRPGTFDRVVRLVADDAVANVLMVSPDCRWALHPYDGGMDVIVESAVERDRLKATHADWLSPYPGGL